ITDPNASKLADLAVKSAKAKAGRTGKDGISYLLSVKRQGISTPLMQEYEKDNENTIWNPESFKKAMDIIDSRLQRESEWNLNGDTMRYQIKTCNITREDNSFNTYICHTAREAFKGALNYAFGNKAELKIEKLLSRGDKCCEVTIKIH
ncbi:MAG: hypothetical protein ACNA7I_09975, partial [Candidatus Methanoperedens sp.]